MKFDPLIKWSGSKRKLSEQIIQYFPEKIETYYEPFCGSCSVGLQLILTNHNITKYIFSDINRDLIDFLNLVKNDCSQIIKNYEQLWCKMKNLNDIDKKVEFYNNIRKQYNSTKNIFYFIFLSRTCVNGLIRYNSKGEFNSPLNKNRDGIIPKRFENILKFWNKKFNENNVEFIVQNYTKINANEGDFVFLDPPYFNIKGMYNGTINSEEYFNFLKMLNSSYAFTLDGKRENKDYTYAIPKEVYTEHIYLKPNVSGFMKMHNSTEHFEDSLYLNLK